MKLYLSGGMRSVGPMVSALDSVDGIGLDDLQRASLDLRATLWKGVLRSAQAPHRCLMAAGAQIWQIARGKEPFQLWDEKVLAQLEQDLGTWFGKKAEDGDKLEHTKPVEYTGPQNAYGSSAAVIA
ncbi:unnamed protein product [Clonostachys rosea f. rosea IK726]|uniref:Uncharacterized protein n=1 Tax=Clonostachys rosea f. rosea IK726 TaxID=1349383 RepID=A0ACA9UEF3_BIOOC|nr:unnamed protein product [Clonostachys rosea f. rosea IK726]